MIRAVALMLAVAVFAAGVLAAASSGARQTPRTIGLVIPAPSGSPISPEVEKGGRSAAAALGDRLVVIAASVGTIQPLIAHHAAAIIVDNDGGGWTYKALVQARSAGVPTVSYEQAWPGSVWVSQSSSAQYSHALADALATQMNQRGQYLIVPCQPAEDIVQTWLKETKTYIRRRYPGMHLAGVVYGATGNGDAGTLVLKPVLKAHPQVRGLDFLCPSESYTGPPQLIKDHEVGKVFSAGNGADCPPLYSAYAWNVRRGAEQIVCAGDPTKLGYLTVWAADYLARGHKLAPGSYDVGGPVGTVRYYGQNDELRLGRPLTITKVNLGQYAGK
jgi:ABC-type sugar transport system substrate-binding protein